MYHDLNRLPGRFIVLCCLSVALWGTLQAAAPNVVLIMTDDQGWGDVGIHGNPIIDTPTLDRLGGQSVRLNRFYVSPVCAPTRAALLTGRYPERTGVAGVTSRQEVMRSGEVTIAELFREAGFHTGCFGKWHNGAQMPLHPNGQGFDEFFGFCAGHFNLYDDPLLQRNGQPVQTSGYITDLITDEAIEFIKANREEPFLCYVPYNAPHGPFQVRRDLFDKYNTGEISEKTAAVYAMVENIDDNVDRILQTLDQSGLSESTIVIFMTDNGPNGQRYNGGMRGAKGSVHEGGCRVPCFIRWPKKLQPRTIDQITGHIDLLPTLAELCGVDLPKGISLDGESLVRLLRDGEDQTLDDRSILTYRPDRQELDRFGRGAVRTNRYRLTIERGKTALFDMRDDPDQTRDIADQRPGLTRQMEQQIRDYFQSIVPSITAVRHVPISNQRPVFIPSVDATLEGEPEFANGIRWAHSWVDRWVSPKDRIGWPLEFNQPGRYHIAVHYVCSDADVPITATLAGQTLSAKLPRFAQKSVVRPDLDSESTPRMMLTFRRQSLGVVDVDAQQTVLELTRGSTGNMIRLGGVTVTSADVPAKESFHLFLLAGQSNMAGRGKVTPVDQHADPRILMLDAKGQWVPAVDPVHFDKSVAGVGLASEFARQYARQHPDVTVGLVPCAVGGSSVTAWQPGGYHSQTKSHPYDDAQERIDLAAEDGTFRGILWHQGESDSKPERAGDYEAQLRDVLNRFRVQLGEDVPILIGGLARKNVANWSDSRKQVDAAHRRLAEAIPAAAFIDSAGLTLKSDNVHFDRKSLLEFGRRYAEALRRLESDTP